jgi:glycosyltransferase involved in cell wall biosynthesis
MRDEKISIAFFLPSLSGGGTERIVTNIANNLDVQKYDASLVLSQARGEFSDEIGKNVQIINLNATGNLKLFFKLIRYFNNEKPEIFISSFPRFDMIALLAKMFSKSKAKVIIIEHVSFSFHLFTASSAYKRILGRFVLPGFVKIFYPMADAIVCVSNGVAKDISKIINRTDKVKVIYNPVISEKIYRLSEEAVEHEWFLDQKVPVVLAVGRLAKQKDYPTLLSAFKLIVQKDPARLVILGEGEDRNKLEKLSQKLGISKNVLFLGFQKNPYKYIKRASVFALSSLQEGFGNVIVEAMACGTSVVATDCQSGPNEIIENGKNGLLVPVRDPKSLAACIIKLLESDSLRESFSREGKIRAEDFTIEKKIKEYEKLFLNVIKK